MEQSRAGDIRRVAAGGAAVGPDVRIAVDAIQRWDRDEVLDWICDLQIFDLAWVEQPMSPNDILAHDSIAAITAPTRMATGEHDANQGIFKLFLQANAFQLLQIDATRVTGFDENIAIMLLAVNFGVPVFPHAGVVRLGAIVQRLAMFNSITISGTTDERMIEFADRLDDYFVAPVDVHNSRYWTPILTSSGAEILVDSRLRGHIPLGSGVSEHRADP